MLVLAADGAAGGGGRERNSPSKLATSCLTKDVGTLDAIGTPTRVAGTYWMEDDIPPPTVISPSN